MKRGLFALLTTLLPLWAIYAQTPDLDRAASLSAQVVKLYQANKPAEGLPLAKEALALREKGLGAEHPLTGAALHNLASLYWRLGDLKMAAPPAQRALAILEQAKPCNEASLAGTLTLLGGILYAVADFEQAALHFQRALTIRENLSGPEHPETLDLVITLANTYKNAGQTDSAEFLYRAYIETQTRRGGPVADTGYALERLSCLLRVKGTVKEAEALEKRSDTLLGYGGPFLQAKPRELREKQLSRPEVNIVLDKKYLNAFSYFREGEIGVRLLLNEQGEPLRACAFFGPPFLFAFYENAARRTKFSPFTVNRQPVKASGELHYIYEVETMRQRKN